MQVVKADRPTSFRWGQFGAGNWSNGGRWSNNFATGVAPDAGGRSDYVLDFTVPDASSADGVATCDYIGEFQLNHLNFGGRSIKVDGRGLAFVANGATGALPCIRQRTRNQTTIGAPLRLAADLTVDVARDGTVALEGPISGASSLIKNGPGRLSLADVVNTYRGGTLINRGSLFLIGANRAFGAGPITLNSDASLDLEHIDGVNPLILNGGTINAGNGFGDSWNGPITLNGNTPISAYAAFTLNRRNGGISGAGGLTQIGSVGPFGMVNGGTLVLCGVNTYAGPTIVRLGTLQLLKPVSLYNADMRRWIAAKISVAAAATLRLSVGGRDEFTGPQADTLLKKRAQVSGPCPGTTVTPAPPPWPAARSVSRTRAV